MCSRWTSASVYVKGRILDSAFTLTWDHAHDKLLEAIKAATITGIRVGSPRWYNIELIRLLTTWYRCPPGRICRAG